MVSLIVGKYKCGDDAPISGGEVFEAEQKNKEVWLDENLWAKRGHKELTNDD